MVARLAARIGRLEKLCPPPAPGCDACRGKFVMGEGDYAVEQRGGQEVYVCAGCRLPVHVRIIVGINLAEAI